MLPDGITECRHCGQPCAGSSCDDCAWRDVLEDGPRELAEARRELAEINIAAEAARVAWEIEHATLLDDQRSLRATVAELEHDLRQAALMAYAQTGERQVAPGVTIKRYQTPVYDERAALAWATRTGLCLALDRRAFDKQARLLAASADKPAWLEMIEEPRATIVSDLAAAVATEGARDERAG